VRSDPVSAGAVKYRLDDASGLVAVKAKTPMTPTITMAINALRFVTSLLIYLNTTLSAQDYAAPPH
jgi:hypothetical protein